MPCYSTVLNEVALEGMGVGVKLKAALEAIGAEVVWDEIEGIVRGFTYGIGRHVVTRDGRIQSAGSVESLNQVKGQVRVSYSANIIKEQARRNGWAVKKLSSNRYQVIRRSS